MNDVEPGKETRFGYMILKIKQKQETHHADEFRTRER